MVFCVKGDFKGFSRNFLGFSFDNTSDDLQLFTLQRETMSYSKKVDIHGPIEIIFFYRFRTYILFHRKGIIIEV